MIFWSSYSEFYTEIFSFFYIECAIPSTRNIIHAQNQSWSNTLGLGIAKMQDQYQDHKAVFSFAGKRPRTNMHDKFIDVSTKIAHIMYRLHKKMTKIYKWRRKRK